MNELAIGRRKEAAIFRQQGTVKAEKQAAASAAQSTRKPASTAASDSVQQRMTGALRAEALTRESRRTLQSGEAILSEVQESLGRLAKLAEKAAGGGEVDRAALQKELEHLLSELDRMAESAAGGSSLFLPGALPGGNTEGIPGWLLQGLTRPAFSPETILAALGLDKNASGADIMAAIAGKSPESSAAVGYLTALYLGAVISGGGQTEKLDPTSALDGLRKLLTTMEGGVSMDQAIELLTGGEFTSLADFQSQFTDGKIPGMEEFLTDLLLTGGEPMADGSSLLALLAATFDGMAPDLLMDLLAALPVPGAAAGPGDPASAGPDAALAGSASGLPGSPEAAPLSLQTFGNVQVMGRDLSGVSLNANGVLTIGGTADVTILGSGQGQQALRLTGSGAVILHNADISTLTAASPEAHIISVGGNTLGAVQLGENTALTLDGGFLRLASLQGGTRSLLRLTGGAAVLLGDPVRSTSTSALTVPVILDGPASLMARASSVRDPGGKALQPFDVVWKTLMPGFHALTSLEIDGQRSRMALTRDHAMRLWLAKGDLSNQGYPAHSLVMRGRDQMGRLRTRYAYLQWDQRTGGFQESEPYPNPFTVTGGEPGEDWVYEEGSHTLRILTSQVSGISGGSGVDADQSPFSGRIVLEDGIGPIQLALRGVACRVTSGRAFYLGCGNDVTLLPEGGTANYFESGTDCAGISLGEGTSLRVDCTHTNGLTAGTVTASGGTSIGGDKGRLAAGRILIRGGAV